MLFFRLFNVCDNLLVEVPLKRLHSDEKSIRKPVKAEDFQMMLRSSCSRVSFQNKLASPNLFTIQVPIVPQSSFFLFDGVSFDFPVIFRRIGLSPSQAL